MIHRERFHKKRGKIQYLVFVFFVCGTFFRHVHFHHIEWQMCNWIWNETYFFLEVHHRTVWFYNLYKRGNVKCIFIVYYAKTKHKKDIRYFLHTMLQGIWYLANTVVCLERKLPIVQSCVSPGSSVKTKRDLSP